MDFDAPQYEVVQSGRPPRQVFEATLTIKTRRGEIIDCQPTYTAKSKKAACTEVAWLFIEQMVERGLLQKDKVPTREMSMQLTSKTGINSTDVKAIDLSPEAKQAGGNWNLAQAIHRFHTFCQLIKCPMDITLNAYGPDHDRQTDAHCKIKFQIVGETEPRVYSASVTCQNKKQAQSAAALMMIRQLYADGYVEQFRKPMKMPPRVIFSKSEGTTDQAAMDEDEKKITGGWVLANSINALTIILKRWGIDPNFWCEPRGKPTKYTFIMFISELRLTLTMKTQAQLTTKHELFAFGRQKSKKDSRAEAAVSMMRQLYKFGICQAAFQSTHRLGKNAHLWEIKLGLQGAPYEPDDIYVTNKLNTMRPDPEELTYPSTVVSHIEAALKCCSDWLHEEEIAEEYSAALAGKRTLLGMQRVGPIAMDMMLTGERRAHVVLTCGRRPTRKLLEQVAGKTIQMLQYTSRGFINQFQMNQDFAAYHKAQDEAENAAKEEAEQEEKFKKLAEEQANADKKAEEEGEEDDDEKEMAKEDTEEVQKETIQWSWGLGFFCTRF